MTSFAMMGGFFPGCFVLFLLGNNCGQSGEQICQFLLHLPIWGTNATAAQLNVSDGAQLYELISQVKFLTQMD
jgi:hypothetical protein